MPYDAKDEVDTTTLGNCASNKRSCSELFRRGLHSIQTQIQHEMIATWENIRSTRLSIGLVFAIICVLVVIIGNIIILIATNFWIATFPVGALAHNSSQIAIQVVSTSFIVIFFSLLAVAFAIYFGVSPLYHMLVDTDRVYHPLLRAFLLFASGATNAISSLLGVYSMTHTPEFIQAVLMCAIPFSAQAWTVIFIVEERKRNYLSVFFLSSFVFFVAGVLLSSMSAFLVKDGTGASWEWALIYLLSSIFFGLWCVVQRLYLDGITRKGNSSALLMMENNNNNNKTTTSSTDAKPHHSEEPIYISEDGETPQQPHPRSSSEEENGVDDDDDEMNNEEGKLIMERRQWASRNVEDNAAKVVLLVGGLIFQLFVSFVLFPIDAIPWFGTSRNAKEAWNGFKDSVRFIFSSWLNVRYGLLSSLGYAMSFFGCTYLNEHSPTLASVVLQLAGPITSIVILIIPAWNVYQDNGNVGHKVGGVILLLMAALLYHLWEQQSLRELIAKSQAAQKEEQERRRGGN